MFVSKFYQLSRIKHSVGRSEINNIQKYIVPASQKKLKYDTRSTNGISVKLSLFILKSNRKPVDELQTRRHSCVCVTAAIRLACAQLFVACCVFVCTYLTL